MFCSAVRRESVVEIFFENYELCVHRFIEFFVCCVYQKSAEKSVQNLLKSLLKNCTELLENSHRKIVEKLLGSYSKEYSKVPVNSV